MVQTTDFFYPLVDDPYIMGKITCANVLSDLYATGITHCDNMLMLLGISTDMTEDERKIVIPMIMKGFSDSAELAGSTVYGGQTVKNPWVLIGGTATAVVSKESIISLDSSQHGDVIVLTKPLGTRIIGNAYQWYDQNTDRWEKVRSILSGDKLVELYLQTSNQMALLNKTASELMIKYNVHACTDVTGFGILGHAQNLSSYQKNDVSFIIHTLPMIEHVIEISDICGVSYQLREGFCAETSGGLFIVLPKNEAECFCRDISSLYGCTSAWIIGDVVGDVSKTARLAENVKYLSVSPVTGPK